MQEQNFKEKYNLSQDFLCGFSNRRVLKIIVTSFWTESFSYTFGCIKEDMQKMAIKYFEILKFWAIRYVVTQNT